jgi:predicted phosphodiesterase
MPFYIGVQMKIAIFSDIHGNVPALQAILQDIQKENVDKTIFLGDAIAIGPKPKECLEMLINNDIIFVPGNHELYYCIGPHIEGSIDDEEWQHQTWIVGELAGKYKEHLQSLPLVYNIEANGKKYSFSHFIPARERNLFPFERLQAVKENGPEMYIDLQDSDYMFVGHEHRPFVATKNNKHLIDVGSSGCTKDNKTHYTIFDTKTNSITTKKLVFDREMLEKDIKETNYPDRSFLAKIFFGIEI